jgi:hypothetical protein
MIVESGTGAAERRYDENIDCSTVFVELWQNHAVELLYSRPTGISSCTSNWGKQISMFPCMQARYEPEQGHFTLKPCKHHTFIQPVHASHHIDYYVYEKTLHVGSAIYRP